MRWWAGTKIEIQTMAGGDWEFLECEDHPDHDPPDSPDEVCETMVVSAPSGPIVECPLPKQFR